LSLGRNRRHSIGSARSRSSSNRSRSPDFDCDLDNYYDDELKEQEDQEVQDSNRHDEEEDDVSDLCNPSLLNNLTNIFGNEFESTPEIATTSSSPVAVPLKVSTPTLQAHAAFKASSRDPSLLFMPSSPYPTSPFASSPSSVFPSSPLPFSPSQGSMLSPSGFGSSFSSSPSSGNKITCHKHINLINLPSKLQSAVNCQYCSKSLQEEIRDGPNCTQTLQALLQHLVSDQNLFLQLCTSKFGNHLVQTASKHNISDSNGNLRERLLQQIERHREAISGRSQYGWCLVRNLIGSGTSSVPAGNAG
jgi:hypothetical protein